MVKMKTLSFRSFAACDLKVVRYREHIKLMKLCDYSRSMSFLDLGQRSFAYKNVKHNFLRNHFAYQNQILYAESFGRGNQSLYEWSRSHDQDGRHANIWKKNLSNLLCNRKADFSENRYDSSKTILVHYSLYKS